MNIFFDVDYTILGWDSSLRPHTRSVFEQLNADGHSVYVWSGMGLRTAVLQQHQLGHLVADVFRKPFTNFDAELEKFGVPIVPDFVIDDHPEIVEHFGGLLIAPYWNKHYADDQLARVPLMVASLAAND